MMNELRRKRQKTTLDTDESFALRPKARILKTLGEELISSETVALIELVKNVLIVEWEQK